MNRKIHLRLFAFSCVALAGLLSSGCAQVLTSPIAAGTATLPAPSQVVQVELTSTPLVSATALPPISGNTPEPTPVVRDASDWKNWPALPVVSDDMKAVYQRGIAAGNLPNHFSILGDCQSESGKFMGQYETDPQALAGLPANLTETINYFAGSFIRLAPTVRPATTAGAILWSEWIDRPNFLYCREEDTPLDCELRYWKPSIVFINLGTHFEFRNYQYLEKILQILIEHGIVPILATKADNREGDESVNLQIAQTAVKYDVPLWNFWITVQDLPNGGLKPETDVEDLYLTDEGLAIHRYTALQALDAVWRQVSAP